MGLKVGVVMGSDSDLEIMKGCMDTLKEMGIDFSVNILSAHRCPKDVEAFSSSAGDNGYGVIIAAAGQAAHLAGVIASGTTLPVIGVPIPSKHLNGIDSLLSTVQMPSGIPVATVAIGSSGAKNAAILAAQILALSDNKLKNVLEDGKKAMREKVLAKNDKAKSMY